jgi:hypothetical protein
MSKFERIEFKKLMKRLPPSFSLETILFGPQLGFARDPADHSTAVCSRRAGKTIGCAARLLDTPLKKQAPSLYFTTTRGQAKRNIWGALLELNRRHNLGFEPNETELVLKRGGKGMVHLSGADSSKEIEKWRGTGWGEVVGDEAQNLPAYLKTAVEDILEPALMDHNGRIALIGTPSPVPVGFFYEACHSPMWSHHHWTVFENPHIPDPRAFLDKILARRGLSENDPAVQREFFGRWVLDTDSLVFKFDRQMNVYSELPKEFTEPWQHVIGVDLGFNDADAIAVLAFNKQSPNLWLRAEDVSPKQTVTQLAGKLLAYVDRFKPNAIVMDAGGLGKKIAEEISARHALPIQAAEKQRKYEYIELLNDAMRSERFFVKSNAKFAHDVMLVEWDLEKSTNDRRVIKDTFHSDITDAVLYAFREALHWTHTPIRASATPGTPAYDQAMNDRLFNDTMFKIQQDKAKANEDPFGGNPFGGWGTEESSW